VRVRVELEEAIEIVVARTGHERFRSLCDPDHPDFNPAYASLVIAMATGEAASPKEGHPSPQQPPTPLESLPLAGDLLAAAAEKISAARLVKYVSEKLGVDCGCESRRVALNRLDASLRKWLKL
jgi:hypothetical protein